MDPMLLLRIINWPVKMAGAIVLSIYHAFKDPYYDQ